MEIFREYDIRGIYGKDVDESIMENIGKAIAIFVRKNDISGPVAVGNDVRSSSPLLSRALIKGITTQGVGVINVRTTSFGVCLFSGWKLKASMTAFVTASHLPPEWNGLKMYTGEGIAISPAAIKGIIDSDENIDVEYEGSVEYADLKRDYIEFLNSKFAIDKEIKIAVDCGNGSMSLVAPELFEALGFDTTRVYCNVDPSSPNRPNDPAPNNIGTLIKTVKDKKLDFGVAFDGDGDRAALVDGKGRVLTGNEIGILLGRQILKNKNGKAVITIACSSALEKELKKQDAEVIKVPVGHTFVISKCKDENALLGVEESGHIVLSEYFAFDDAMLIPLKIAEIIAGTNKSLAYHYDSMIKYPFEDIVFPCPDDMKFTIVQDLLNEFREMYDRVSDMDGVRLDFDDGWILIRASNTSPKIRLYVEATTTERFEDLKKTFTQILKDKLGEKA
ncbi:MAG: phosphomannomutase/phosphoglucomutase [Candidatus Aenigmatarchaeota archaeon]